MPIPEPSENEFLIAISAASLCHSDIMQSFRPNNWGPMIMGHEACGVISTIHPSAEGKGFKVGDKVGFMGNADNCFECKGCELHGTFCANPKGGFARISGMQCDGFFADYAVIDWRNCILVPEGLPMSKASPVFCAGVTGELVLRLFRTTHVRMLIMLTLHSVPCSRQIRDQARRLVRHSGLRWTWPACHEIC